MNITDKICALGIDPTKLEPKKQQTTKKIEYVREYAKLWATISAERDDQKSKVSTINLIDCMYNAGVYSDGDCGTAIEVLLVFQELAVKYPQKLFRIFCNDIDKAKIAVLQTVAVDFRNSDIRNVEIHFSEEDVNDYLDSLAQNQIADGKKVFGFGHSTLLYVDPYDFGTVDIPKISEILKKHYCELVLNFFVSDYVRNIRRDAGRISRRLGGQKISTKDELISYMRTMLKVGHIKHSFAYQFKTMNNVELYQIVFVTPNIRGLEVLKEALWKVFDGAQFHRNKTEPNQLSLFTPEDEKRSNLASYSAEAIKLLQKNFAGQELPYRDIEMFLIENTMLKDSHIIKNVIQPMISAGQAEKANSVRPTNFKKDRYKIKQDGTYQ